ncbi:MAG: DUF501 domain-containing protein [Ilumatobacteraceae bacterium]
MRLAGEPPSEADIADVTRLIGRTPQGDFRVVVRSSSGEPVVVMNAPLLDDGTPMPTLYWLVGSAEVYAVSKLEAEGAVDEVEAIIGLETIDAIHASYGARRDGLIPHDYAGHRPSAGVGGTRRGVKCLHAHFAHWLAGGDDAVGEWVATQLDARGIERAQRI